VLEMRGSTAGVGFFLSHFRSASSKTLICLHGEYRLVPMNGRRR
jgi:hypothetical protein